MIAQNLSLLARTAEAWTPIAPLPPLIAATGATSAVWGPESDIRQRYIIVDGGESPGVFDLEDLRSSSPTPDEIREQTARFRETWDAKTYSRRAPHLALDGALTVMEVL